MALTLFSLLSLALAQAVREASSIWRRSTGESTARLALRRCQNRLTSDLNSASFAASATGPGAVQLPSGGRNGDAVWCLSAIDPASGLYMRKANGNPFYQANVLYYLAVPTQHDQLYGQSCAGFRDAAGYDQGCPHKVLIRKVIDFGSATVPSDESTEEALMTQASLVGYLTHPASLNVSSMMSEPGVRQVQLASTSLLCLRATRSGVTGTRTFDLDASSLSLLDAQRHLAVGSSDLSDTAYTNRSVFAVSTGMP